MKRLFVLVTVGFALSLLAGFLLTGIVSAQGVVGRPGNPWVVTCPKCDGNGKCHNPYCKGRGTWREGNTGFKCVDCNGTGKCADCGGTGKKKK